MVEQDELLITRSSSNLNKYDSEQLDVQEESPVVSKFLNNSSNVCGMDKFINEKNCETSNKPAKCSMDSQQNFFNHLLNEIQFLREEVRMKNIIIKSLLLSKSLKHNEQNLAYKLSYRNSWTLDARFGRWALDAGLSTPDSEPWTLNSRRWTPDIARLWMCKTLKFKTVQSF